MGLKNIKNFINEKQKMTQIKKPCRFVRYGEVELLCKKCRFVSEYKEEKTNKEMLEDTILLIHDYPDCWSNQEFKNFIEKNETEL